MLKSIKITFPIKKKNKDDIYRTMAEFHQIEDSCCFVLPETNRDLQRKNHSVIEGCIIQDLVTDETFKCIGVTFTIGKSKHPIMQVVPF